MDLIARGTSGYTKKKRDESMQHYLKRLTHLYLEDRHIDDVVSKIVSWYIIIFSVNLEQPDKQIYLKTDL